MPNPVVAIAGSTIVSGAMSSRAASSQSRAIERGNASAAAATRGATRDQINEMARQFDYVQALNAPGVAFGYGAQDRIAQIMGFSPNYSAIRNAEGRSRRGMTRQQIDREIQAVESQLSAMPSSAQMGPGAGYRQSLEAKLSNLRSSRRYASSDRQYIQPVRIGSQYGADAPGNAFRDQFGFVDPNADNRTLASDTFEEDPGRAFMREEAMKSLLRKQSSKGDRLGGGALREAARYASGLADQSYDKWVGRKQYDINRRDANYQNYLSRLFQAAGQGSGNVSTTSSAAASTGAGISGAIGNQGNALANLYANTGRAQAGAAGQQYSGWNNALQSGMNNYMFYQMMQGNA